MVRAGLRVTLGPGRGKGNRQSEWGVEAALGHGGEAGRGEMGGQEKCQRMGVHAGQSLPSSLAI